MNTLSVFASTRFITQFYTVMHRFIFVISCLLFSIHLSAQDTVVSHHTDIGKPLDLRILMDVSGSMKRTDPKNLRASALQVLTQLLPDDTRIGIWEFAGDISPLVPYGLINNTLRQQVLSNGLVVRSDGQLTDIGKALEAVARPLDSNSSSEKQVHIILLTDGVVDINSNEAVNIRARNQLTNHQQLSHIDPDIRIHTIGLSDDIDRRTLKEISRHTKGLFSIAHNAEDLLGIFLRALDNTVFSQQLKVDSALQQFVVEDTDTDRIAIVVAKNNAEQIIITSPTGEQISIDQAHGLKENVTWQNSQSHDVITIENPSKGTWKLVSDAAKLVRVNIDNRMKLVTELEKNDVFVDQTVPIIVSVMDEKGNAYAPEALANGRVSLTLYNEDDAIYWQQDVPTNGTTLPQHSYLQLAVPAIKAPGLYRLIVDLTTPNKSQQIARNIRVYPPVDYVLTQQITDEGIAYKIDVTPLLSNINLDASEVVLTGKVTDAKSLQKSFSQKLSLGTDTWQGQWVTDKPLQDLKLTLKGKTFDNKPLTYAVNNAQATWQTKADLKLQAQAKIPAVELLPAATVLAVDETHSEHLAKDKTQNGAIQPLVVLEETSKAMQALVATLDGDITKTEAALTQKAPVQVEVTSATMTSSDANINQEDDSNQNSNKVTVEVEPTHVPINTKYVLLSILVLFILLWWLWSRRQK